MSELKITVWKRYGHDRLYVNLPNGVAVAFLDRHTGEVTILRDEYRTAATQALVQYLPSADPPAPPPRPPAPPRPAPRPLPELGREDDLALREPGKALRDKLRDEGPGPVERFVDLLLRRETEWDSWRKGLAGEKRVGRELRRLSADGWFVLHSVPLPRDVDIDHLLIGPGGVFSINTKRHPDKDVWVGDDVVKVDHGKPQPYLRKSRAEARRVRRVLERYCGFEVPVTPVLVFVDIRHLDKVPTLLDVRVYEERAVSALAPLRGVLRPEQVRQLYEIARRKPVWENA
ncbi:NERD domain-containing protein [Streptomyces sp. SDr-06]|uniref:nuclease-related domain-containing protein n=1 Tax=Streptomyces sp. SDr-06 TaxID=2267702 RepID=UPI000DEA65E8|nr:nuclease-related domain-containing protein [Streptomyces sp. SDr-06]RCH69359.1 NERD domain-containing protein [Streptomyces sp. SDr-06]